MHAFARFIFTSMFTLGYYASNSTITLQVSYDNLLDDDIGRIYKLGRYFAGRLGLTPCQ